MKPLIWRYASMRLPLAVLELPLYVLLPKLYSELLPIAVVGLTLLAARALDALSDPWLGMQWDLRATQARQRLRFLAWQAMGFASLVVVLGFMILLWWPTLASHLRLDYRWSGAVLAFGSVCTYLAYSLCSIVYQSWGAALARSDAARSRYALSREGLGLVGVILVSIFLQAQTLYEKLAISCMLLVFTVMGLWLFRGLPYPQKRLERPAGLQTFNLFSLWHWRPMRALFVCFMLSAIAAAVPATLVLFFIEQVLQAPQMAPLFLSIYFLSAAAGLPVWTRLSDRYGHSACWLIAMVIAIAAFSFCLGIEAGDTWSYGLVCVVTGLALGGDVAMPWAILARLIQQKQLQQPEATPIAGRCIGYWTLVSKLNLALAAGIALPLWQWLGSGPQALTWIYAGLPCLLKALSLIGLTVSRKPQAL